MRDTFLAIAMSGALAAAGCGASSSAPPPRPAQQPRPSANVEPAPEKADAAAAPEYVYSAAGKRDPFRSYLAEISKETGFTNKCSTPLGRFGIEQLRLVAVITGLEDPVAMLEAPTGVGYAVRRGACLGRNGGVVAAVRSGEVVVTEWVVRADGTRDPTQTILQIPKQQTVPEE